MDIAAAVSETARGLLPVISPQDSAPRSTDKADVKFRGVLQGPEVLSPATEASFEDRNVHFVNYSYR